ncbi:MAG: hypothetical protein NT076_00790 [Candidatus Pacearchaeota archaeon]|nr:hypothetical protein [Candidatus Pacearchaeota archaeon]
MNDEYLNNLQKRRLKYEMEHLVLESLRTEVEMLERDKVRIIALGEIIFEMDCPARISEILSDYHEVRRRMLNAGLKVEEYDGEVAGLTLDLEKIDLVDE